MGGRGREHDEQLGRVLDALAADTEAGRVRVIVTADHGGAEYSHYDTADPDHYVIPMYVWGAGVPEDEDLYDALGRSRIDPGDAWVELSASEQPVRNMDAANLSLRWLGLVPLDVHPLTPAGLDVDPLPPAPVAFSSSPPGSYDGSRCRLRVGSCALVADVQPIIENILTGGWTDLETGVDWSGDAIPDVWIGNLASGQVDLLDGASGVILGSFLGPAAELYGTSIAQGDFDGNGGRDVAVGTFASPGRVLVEP